MSFYLEETCNIPFDFAYAKLAEDVIAFCLSHENFPYEAEVNLTLTDNEEIHRINLEYRQIDRPTDVLSFPMVDYPAPADFSELEEENASAEYFHPETGELILGDIVISVERARMQAEEYGHSLKREICFLTAHSMLHLFGYDHIEDEERVEMEQRQEQILQALGIIRE